MSLIGWVGLNNNKHKQYITYTSLFVFLLLFFINLQLNISYSIPILVNIKESLHGYFPYFNYSLDGDVVSIKAVWENVGSVTCDVYLRLKIGKRNFWSEKRNVPPGSTGVLEVYAFLPEEDRKNITISPYLYYCNEILQLDNISLLQYNTTSTSLSQFPLNMSFSILSPYEMEIFFTSPADINISEIYIIPISPVGWILPSKKINKNIEHSIKYSFYKPEKSTCCAKFIFIMKDSKDNYFYTSQEINLTYIPPPLNVWDKIKDEVLIASMLINFLFLVAFAFLFIKSHFFQRNKNK